MNVLFTENAWEDYLYWQKMDKKTVKRINELIKDIKRSPFVGMGKPEGLKYDLAGKWSRRITEEHRLVYQVEGGSLKEGHFQTIDWYACRSTQGGINMIIYTCKYHY